MRLHVTPRVTYWTAPHPAWSPNPEWPEDVGCVLYCSESATVLIDPLTRGDWAWLDDLVAAAAQPVTVALTCPWHERDAPEAIRRYEAAVWGSPPSLARLGVERAAPLPDGLDVVALDGVDEGQVAFFLPEERTLVVAEIFLGLADGLLLSPSPATHDLDGFRASVARVLELDVERVLPGHGPPVLSDGRAAIERSLA